VNQELTTTNGTWNDELDDPNPGSLSYTYQWQSSSDGTNFSDITAATASTFTVPETYYSLYVRCQVTATDDGYGTPASQSTTVNSNAIEILNTAPKFVYDGSNYEDGASVEVDAVRDTDLVFDLQATDADDGQNFTWNYQDVTHGSVTITAGRNSQETKQITFTPELAYIGAAEFTISVSDNITKATSYLTFNVTVKATYVHVDDDWTGYSHGDTVQDSLIFGLSAFQTISNSINRVAPNGYIYVYDGQYNEQFNLYQPVHLVSNEEATISNNFRATHAISIDSDDVNISGFVFQDLNDVVTAVGQNISINQCMFQNCATAITNSGTEELDATRNWWGDLHGPKHTNNPNYNITNGSIVSDYVNFFPWDATQTVTPESEYVTVYQPDVKMTIIAVSDVIQTGIDAAVAGNIVEVDDGTYTEDLSIDAGIILRSINGKEYTTIQQIDGLGIEVGANATNFTLGGSEVGFTIESGNNTTHAIRIVEGPANVSIIDNSIDIVGYAFEGISINSAGSDNLTISDNTIQTDNGDSGIWTPNSSNTTISSNSLSCSGNPISGWAIHLSGCSSPTITDNTISNFNIGISLSSGEGFSSGLVNGNDLSGCSHNIYVSQWSPTEVLGTMDNLELSENTISCDQVGIYIGDGSYIDASTFIINYNNFITSSSVTRNNRSLAVKQNASLTAKTKQATQSNNLYGFSIAEPKLTNYGVYNDHSSEVVIAEDNWWNAIDGPYHDPKNTDTTGLNVSDNVDFRPWAIGNPAIDNLDHELNLSISSPGSTDDISSETPIPFQVDFSEIVHNFQKDTEIAISGSYSEASEITDAGSGLYTFDLIPEMDGAQMTVSVAAEAAEDVAGNYNQAASLTITYDAVISRYIITLTPSSPNLLEPFAISLEAVDAYGYRDTDYNNFAGLSSNHPEFVNISNVMLLTDGYAEAANAGLSEQVTDDLAITAKEYITSNYESTLEDIVIQMPPIDPPHGFDGNGDPVVSDVAEDQGGWIKLEYGLSQNDPFHSDAVAPYIYGYRVERNSQPDGSGNWEQFATITCYYPNAAGNATALLAVPEDSTPYPYRMSSLYVPNTTMPTGTPSQPQITYLDATPRDDSYMSDFVFCGYAAGLDNIPAYADIRVLLEGPYVEAGYMSEDLITGGYLEDAPAHAVDKVTVELRDSQSGETLKTAELYLSKFGYIMNEDGGNSLPFYYTTDKQYYLVIKHRNHLDIMSSSRHTFADSPTSKNFIDLTTAGSVYADGAKQIEENIYAMYAGDASNNGQIQNDDIYAYWAEQVGGSGYLEADFNLNTQVQNNDKYAYWITNAGAGSQVPTSDKDNLIVDNSTDKNNLLSSSSDKDGESDITFSFANGVFTGDTYEFDVMLSGQVNGNTLGSSQIYLNYNTECFGENIVANGNVSVSKGTLLQGELEEGSGDYSYSIINVLDNTSARFAISSEYLFSPSESLANQITTIPAQLVHVQLQITDASQATALSFEQNLMQGQTYDATNTDPAVYTVIATDTNSSTLPAVLSMLETSYQQDMGTATINWTSQSELNNNGWNIYRGESQQAWQQGEAVQINSELIAGAGTSSDPTDYSFEDPNSSQLVAGKEYWYFLESINYSGQTCIYDPASLVIPSTANDATLPSVTMLNGNYPNPFNPTTTISFQVRKNETARLSIYNVAGRLVETKTFQPGVYNYQWSSKNNASGVYFYCLKTQTYKQIRKMLLLK
jgi:parallel beta-helix repeat protein